MVTVAHFGKNVDLSMPENIFVMYSGKTKEKLGVYAK